MKTLTPQFSELLQQDIERQFLDFVENLHRTNDGVTDNHDRFFIAGAEIFKLRVLSVIESKTFPVSRDNGGAA